VKRYVLAEFAAEAPLLAAARALRAEGQGDLDLHSPVPLHGADEALGLRKSVVPRIALTAGLIGATTGYLMQWYLVGVDFPINVGGRPPHSPPAFIPVTFELGVLFAALSIFFGLFLLWLSAAVGAEAADAIADRLRGLGARRVEIVEDAS
jgi:hypothetical protein